MIAPIISTIPIMLKTLLPVSDTLLTAMLVTGSVATFVTSERVTKNAKTPTANMISDTTTPIIAPGSMKPYLAFTSLFTSDSYYTIIEVSLYIKIIN